MIDYHIIIILPYNIFEVFVNINDFKIELNYVLKCTC